MLQIWLRLCTELLIHHDSDGHYEARDIVQVFFPVRAHEVELSLCSASDTGRTFCLEEQ